MGERDDEMTSSRVLAEVVRVVSGIRSGDALPDHATLLNLRRWAYSEGIPEDGLLRSLSELRKRGRILVGRTLNDWWIKPAESENAK